MAALAVFASPSCAAQAPLSAINRQEAPTSAGQHSQWLIDTPRLTGRPLSTAHHVNRTDLQSNRFFSPRAANSLSETAGSIYRWQQQHASSSSPWDLRGHGVHHHRRQPNRSSTRPADRSAPHNSTTADPLPVHANGLQLEAPIPAAARSAVDWMLLKAQAVPLALRDVDVKWAFAWQQQQQLQLQMTSPRKPVGPPRPSATQSAPQSARAWSVESYRREALRSELCAMETMLRPKCAWPQPAATVADEDADDKAHKEQIHAQCDWPRHAAITVTSINTSSSSSLTAATALALEAVPGSPSFARCQWPRQAAAAVAAAVSTARCEWPCNTTAAATVAATACLSNTASCVSSSFVSATPHAPGASSRCAHSRESTPTTTRRSSPRHSPSATHATNSLAPQAPSALPTVGPRCYWPRHAATPAADDGPQCVWPRVAAAAAATAEVATSTLTEFLDAPVGPRCEWPHAGKAVRADAPAAPVPASAAAAAAAAVGPRCEWPRRAHVASATSAAVDSASVHAMVVQAVLLGESAAAAADVAEGSRCSWPREVGRRSPEARADVAAVEAAAVPLGPRCPYPRK